MTTDDGGFLCKYEHANMELLQRLLEYQEAMMMTKQIIVWYENAKSGMSPAPVEVAGWRLQQQQ